MNMNNGGGLTEGMGEDARPRGTKGGGGIRTTVITLPTKYTF